MTRRSHIVDWFSAFDLIGMLDPTGIGGSLVVPAAFLLGIGVAMIRRRDDDDSEGAEDNRVQLLPDQSLGDDQREVPPLDTAESHARVLAPAAIDWETRAAKVGDTWTSTLYIADYPDYPNDGYLSDLFELSDVTFDLTAHITPKNQDRAESELQSIAEDRQVDADIANSVRSEYLQERAHEAVATYTAVQNGTRVFGQGVYVTVRGEDKQELESSVQKIKSTLRDDPAALTPKTAVCRQDLAIQSAAPIGRNVFGRESIALGDAVGALLASPHNATILEEGGVEFGLHKDNQSPVVIDPFDRDNGYAMVTVGDTGSGKSFSAKQNFVRSIEQSENRIGVILEPLNNWAGVSTALNAKRITVGGNLGLNPLELRQTPESIQQTMGDDASPFNEKLDDVMSFLTNFFAHRGISLGERRTTLELALRRAYERQGITDDISTHDNPSPTIQDVMTVLEDMAETPNEYVGRLPEEAERIHADASWLVTQLRPFEDGQRYGNLGGESEFDIRDEKVVYLDLAQQEGSESSNTALTMQLLISLVYERAKATDKEVVFVIDEARYIMKDAVSLSFLETVFRHHRHHDLSVRLVTQTVDEFFQHSETEAILDQCAVKQFHRLDGMDEQWATEFGMNHAQMQFVQDAIPGNEETGYSEALVGVDGEWRGIKVRAMPKEQQIIDYDPAVDSRVSLPGVSDPSSTDASAAADRTRDRR